MATDQPPISTRRGRESDSQEEDTVFDDPLMTPPTTDADAGNWDADEPLRGVVIEHPNRSVIVDAVIERQWEATESERQSILLRCTRYHRRDHTIQAAPDYGERETYYVGWVHAPDVDSAPAGCFGTYIRDCNPDGDWFSWSERHWQNNPSYTETRQEMAVGKTNQLARCLNSRAEGNI
jgi:hypothetical protein